MRSSWSRPEWQFHTWEGVRVFGQGLGELGNESEWIWPKDCDVDPSWGWKRAARLLLWNVDNVVSLENLKNFKWLLDILMPGDDGCCRTSRPGWSYYEVQHTLNWDCQAPPGYYTNGLWGYWGYSQLDQNREIRGRIWTLLQFAMRKAWNSPLPYWQCIQGRKLHRTLCRPHEQMRSEKFRASD
jgi:hypothetical protein